MNCQASVLMTVDMATIVPLSSFESTADIIYVSFFRWFTISHCKCNILLPFAHLCICPTGGASPRFCCGNYPHGIFA